MFERLQDVVDADDEIVIELDGETVTVPAAVSVAAVLLYLGAVPTRNTPLSGVARAPFCMMGVCFECLVEIDGVGNLRAEGDDRLTALSFKFQGKSRRIETELLMLHQGVIPALHIAATAACETRWNEVQQCWQASVDEWGESSQGRIFVAGDAAVIGGARAAWLSGKLAGLQVAHQLGRLGRDERDRSARYSQRPRKTSCHTSFY